MVKSFLSYLKYEKRYSSHTLKAYKKDIQDFLNYLGESESGEPDLTLVGYQDIRGWIYHLSERGLDASSINRYISALRSLYRFLVYSGHMEHSPMNKVSNLKTKKRLPEVLTTKEMMQLFDRLEASGEGAIPSSDQERLILQILYETGMRRSELIDLRISDIDQARQTIRVVGKGNKERSIPVRSALLMDIQEYISKAVGSLDAREECRRFLFEDEYGKKMNPKTVYNIVNKYLNLVSTRKKKSPHVLRHSFATHMLDEGADIQSIKELLGHAGLAATQIYTHNSIEKLKKAYASHPLFREED